MTWTVKNNALHTTIKFKDFSTAWAFLTEVAIMAATMNHHPTWTNTYNTVDITLTTHDAGNIITVNDHLLAEKITQSYKKYEN